MRHSGCSDVSVGVGLAGSLHQRGEPNMQVSSRTTGPPTLLAARFFVWGMHIKAWHCMRRQGSHASGTRECFGVRSRARALVGSALGDGHDLVAQGLDCLLPCGVVVLLSGTLTVLEGPFQSGGHPPLQSITEIGRRAVGLTGLFMSIAAEMSASRKRAQWVCGEAAFQRVRRRNGALSAVPALR
jgi:hypothetical protein